jgi:large subunit ribosomal protein L35
MPKYKTNSSARKRFRVTGTGKVMRMQRGHSHYMEHKTSKRARRLIPEVVVAKPDRKKVRRLIGPSGGR